MRIKARDEHPIADALHNDTGSVVKRGLAGLVCEGMVCNVAGSG